MLPACLAIAVLYIASTALTPLYPIYRHEFVFSELVVTEIYAVYVVGNLASLFFFGRVSDQAGRRVTALVAFAITALSAVLFLTARGTGGLMAARIVNGFSAGLGAGALTAWISTGHGRRLPPAARISWAWPSAPSWLDCSPSLPPPRCAQYSSSTWEFSSSWGCYSAG